MPNRSGSLRTSWSSRVEVEEVDASRWSGDYSLAHHVRTPIKSEPTQLRLSAHELVLGRTLPVRRSHDALADVSAATYRPNFWQEILLCHCILMGDLTFCLECLLINEKTSTLMEGYLFQAVIERIPM